MDVTAGGALPYKGTAFLWALMGVGEGVLALGAGFFLGEKEAAQR